MHRPLFRPTPTGMAVLSAALLGCAQIGPAAGQTNLAPVAVSPVSAKAVESKKAADVEARIKTLHEQLGITASQESAWDAVGEVMRQNARQMHDAVELREQAKNLTAIDDLKGYQAIANAHTESLDKLIPVFQTLYDTLSEDQKRKADAIFADSHHRT